MVIIEAKASRNIIEAHLKGLRQLAVDQTVRPHAIVCLEPRRWVTSDGITTVPASDLADFLDEIAAEGV